MRKQNVRVGVIALGTSELSGARQWASRSGFPSGRDVDAPPHPPSPRPVSRGRRPGGPCRAWRPHGPAAQAPADRDGDGTPDSSDQCPDLPGGFAGCPQPPTSPGGNFKASADRDGDGLPRLARQVPGHLCGAGYQGCPPPSDRDGDHLPDSSDRCPDAAGNGGVLQGCPQSADRDGDLVLDMDDACPDTRGKQADGCEPFVWRLFFSTGGIKRFLSHTRAPRTAGPGQVQDDACDPHPPAKTAKAAGIKKRRIASISVPSLDGHPYNISRANRKKLARLKKVTLTIRAYVTMATGKTLKPQQKTRTIYRKLGVAQQFNSNGTTNDGV